MDIQGKVKCILPEKTGTSSKGREWKSREFVIETDGQYPKRVCLECQGGKIDQLNDIKEGDIVAARFDIDANEWHGKWFNRFSCWKVEKMLP